MRHVLIILAIFICASATAEIPWNFEALKTAPATYPAPALEAEGVRALFYDGLPWKGKPTRVFAWFGLPEVPPGEKVPAMVLAHGGGGTAFDEWVRIWTARGYAAIAMDLEGTLPKEDYPNRPQHEHSGPHRLGAFEDLAGPPEEQWYYHAVADIILADSLLRSMPEIDSQRIGLTGISWGGILSGTVAGVDDRFQFVIPVYGCGFLDVAPVFTPRWDQLGPEITGRWTTLWDPSTYLPNAKMPMLFVNGANDLHFPLNIHTKSYNLVPGPKALSVRVGAGHSHPDGWRPEEIYAYADSFTRSAVPLPALSVIEMKGDTANAAIESLSTVENSVLIYTTDVTDWAKAVWQEAPAAIDGQRITAAVPPDAKAWFFNLTHSKGLVSSSPVMTR